MKVLPVFSPNDHLINTHSKAGKEKWEVFAWAVRDVMAKAGGLRKDDQPYIYISREAEVRANDVQV